MEGYDEVFKPFNEKIKALEDHIKKLEKDERAKDEETGRLAVEFEKLNEKHSELQKAVSGSQARADKDLNEEQTKREEAEKQVT